VLISLLEQHDPSHIDADHAILFLPILARLWQSPDMPFQARYNLAQRASNLSATFRNRVRNHQDLADTTRELHSMYQKELSRPWQTNHLADRQVTAATDAELRADVEMQLQNLQGLNMVERVFQTIPPGLIQHSSNLSVTQSAILQREKDIAATRYAQQRASGTETVADTQDPAEMLFTFTSKASEAPGVVEAQRAFADTQSNTISTQADDVLAGAMQDNGRILYPQPDGLSTMDQRPLSPALDRQAQEPEQEAQQPDDSDELAMVAGDLLEKVADNRSSKFQNSSFLTLMRRLRDKEVKVQGDKVIESNASMAEEAVMPDYIPPSDLTGSQPGAHVFTQTPISERSRIHTANDGQAVVDLLNQPATEDVDSEFMMTSPFYDNQHAELGRRGLFFE